VLIRCSEYKPELERLAAEKQDKQEADKKASLERLMRDMKVSAAGAGGAPASKGERGDVVGGNPFRPHARNERQDR
jgi:hypothetical protein